MTIYLSRLHYHHLIYLYRIKKMEIMGNNNNQLRHTSPFFYLLGEDIYRSDIESCIDLIEKYTHRVEKSYLKHLYTTLLSSREPDIEISIKEFCIESIFRKHLFYHTSKYKRGRSFGIRIMECKVMTINRTEVFEKSYPWDFRNILKREEHPSICEEIRSKI